MPVSLLLSEMSFSWIEGWFGLFPHCLILNSDEWSCVYAQTSPKGWRAGCGKHCSALTYLAGKPVTCTWKREWTHRGLEEGEPWDSVVRGLESGALSKSSLPRAPGSPGCESRKSSLSPFFHMGSSKYYQSNRRLNELMLAKHWTQSEEE